jgi:hypothetical protein
MQKQQRWSVQLEISLLKEVVGKRPARPADWESVAKVITELSGATYTERNCKEHTKLLINRFKAENRKVLKK